MHKIQKKYKLETNKGIYIKNVEKYKAADLGNRDFHDLNDMNGLKKNDIIIEVNDQIINNVDDFNAIKDSLNNAEQMKCKVIRNNETMYVTIWVTWNNL